MAIVKAFRATFPSRNSDTYRLTIYDMAADDTASNNNALYGYNASASTDPKPIDLIHDSLVISHEGAVDIVHTPIISSNLEVTALLNRSSYYLLDIIAARKEGEVAVKLERHDGTSTDVSVDADYEDVFIGSISPEAIVYDFSNTPIEVNLIFSDGISLLRDEPYEKDNGDPWTDDATFETLRTQIGHCISKMPHLPLYTDTVNDPFFVEQLDIFHWNHVKTSNNRPAGILDKSGCNQQTWYETRLHTNPFNRKQKYVTGGSTCYEVIQDIMVALGATFMCHSGTFWVVSPFMQDSNGTNNYDRLFKSDKRSLTDSSYQDSASLPYPNVNGYPNRIDYRSADILMGSTISYFNPAKAVAYTHKEGGAPFLFKEPLPVTIHGEEFSQNVYYNHILESDPTTPSYDSGYGGYLSVSTQTGKSFPLTNDDYTALGGQVLVIKGRMVIDSQLTASDDLFVGAQPVVKLKIKVGDQYLKQTVSLVPDSDLLLYNNFGRIHIALANPMDVLGNDITTWNPLKIDSDVEWSTTSSDRFEFPYMTPGQMQPEIDTIEHSDGENVKEYAVGMNTRRHENFAGRMRFRWSDRKNEHDLLLDIVTPELPGDSSDTYSGVEIDAEVIVYKNDGNTIAFEHADVPYEAARIHNFRVMVGEDKEKEDVLYVAAADTPKGTEVVDGGSTMLASRLQAYYGDIGVLRSNEPGHRTSGDLDGYGEYWFSEGESGRNPSDSAEGQTSMEVISKEHLALRQDLTKVYNVSLLQHDHHLNYIWPLRRVIIETGTTDAVVQVMSSVHHVMAGQFDFTGFELSRVGAGITGTTSDSAKELYRKGPNRPPGPKPAEKSARVSGVTSADAAKLSTLDQDKDDLEALNFYLER